MQKTWYININGKKLGPYTLRQLKCHPQVTPDTLVWIPEASEWKPIRLIPELQEIFKDPENLEFKEETDGLSDKFSNALVLELQTNPPDVTWILFLITVTLLILIQILKYKLFH